MELPCVWEQESITAISAWFYFRFFKETTKRLRRDTIFWINNKFQQAFKGWKYKNPYGAA